MSLKETLDLPDKEFTIPMRTLGVRERSHPEPVEGPRFRQRWSVGFRILDSPTLKEATVPRQLSGLDGGFRLGAGQSAEASAHSEKG